MRLNVEIVVIVYVCMYYCQPTVLLGRCGLFGVINMGKGSRVKILKLEEYKKIKSNDKNTVKILKLENIE